MRRRPPKVRARKPCAICDAPPAPAPAGPARPAAPAVDALTADEYTAMVMRARYPDGGPGPSANYADVPARLAALAAAAADAPADLRARRPKRTPGRRAA